MYTNNDSDAPGSHAFGSRSPGLLRAVTYRPFLINHCAHHLVDMIELSTGQPLTIRKKSDQVFGEPRDGLAVAAWTVVLFPRPGADDVIWRFTTARCRALPYGFAPKTSHLGPLTPAGLLFITLK